MKIKSLFLLSALAVYGCMEAGELPRTSPEAQGMDSGKVIELLDSLTSIPQTELHSLTVLRHGNVVAQAAIKPFSTEDQHELFSVSKTFTAAAVGLAIADNLLRLDDRLGAILPEALPDSVSPWLADVTVRDLLTMTSGLKVDWGMRGREDKWAEIMMAEPMAHEPGKQFAYDSMSTYLLSALVQKVVGKNILEYLTERVFNPLGMEDYTWDLSPEGVVTGGWGLWMRPDDLAKFGQLLLDKGKWEGKQILPAEWVNEMMTKRVDVPGTSNYCFQMWTCPHEDAVRADGAWGQYIIVMPKEDMVAVVTQCQQGVSDRIQALVWNTLTPTLSDSPKKEGKEARRLEARLKSYSHAFPAGKSSAKAPFLNKTLTLAENPMGWKTLEISQNGKEIHLTATNAKGQTDEYVCGYKAWKKTRIVSNPPDERSDTHNRFSGHTNPFYADGAYGWSGNALNAKLHYTNWYSSLALTVAPAESANHALVTFKLNFMGSPVTVGATF